MKHSESLREILKLNPWSYISPPNSAAECLQSSSDKRPSNSNIKNSPSWNTFFWGTDGEYLRVRFDVLNFGPKLCVRNQGQKVSSAYLRPDIVVEISSTLKFAQTRLLCGVRGVSERVAMGIDLRESKMILDGYQTRIRMNKPTISWVLEIFKHFTFIAWQVENQRAERVEMILQQETGPVLVWAPKMKKALHDIEGSPAGTGSSHPFLLRRNHSGGWRRDVRPGGGTILFMSAEADVVRSDKSGSKQCRFCVFFLMFPVFLVLCHCQIVPSKETSWFELFNCSETFNFTSSHQGPKGVVESDEIVRIPSTSTFQTSPSSSSKDEQMSCHTSCPTESKWWVFTFLMFYWTRTPSSLLSQKGTATTKKAKGFTKKGP